MTPMAQLSASCTMMIKLAEMANEHFVCSVAYGLTLHSQNLNQRLFLHLWPEQRQELRINMF